jgi:hypothetical protein
MFTERKHLSSPSIFCAIHVTKLYFSVWCFVDDCGPFSYGHYIVCSSIYCFWLPFYYLQTFHKEDLLIFVVSFRLLLTILSIWHICYRYCAVFYMPVTNIVPGMISIFIPNIAYFYNYIRECQYLYLFNLKETTNISRSSLWKAWRE